MKLQLGCLALAYLSMFSSLSAQTAGGNVATTTAATQTAAQSVAPATQVPRLVKFSGTVQNFNADEAGGGVVAGNSAGVLSTVVGMTFSLYSQQTGGVPLWSEVQNVQIDSTGHYTVQLGSTQPDGLPVELFSSAEAQWLGVRQEGQAEQPRIMLLSVPYALKAADAETFGGKPPSAFVQVAGAGANDGLGSAPAQNEQPLVSGMGGRNYLAVWISQNELASSTIWNLRWMGIMTHTPEAPLEVDTDPTNAAGPNLLVRGTGPASGIYATSAANSGSTYGVSGSADSPNGTGVAGAGTSFIGPNRGVWGLSNSSSGYGVYGESIAYTGTATGVYGTTTSTMGAGVAGLATATAGANYGVYAESSSPAGLAVLGKNLATTGGALGVGATTASTAGVAILGVGVTQSDESGDVTLRPIGVWGDTNQDSGIGVLATADYGIAFAGYNDADNISTGKFVNDEEINEEGNVFATLGGYFGGICEIDVSGDLGCTGSVGGGLDVDGGTRKVSLYAVQAAENWFEDAGSGQLSNGAAVVRLEPTFAQTVNTSVDYHVFLTPNGDCKGLYVTNKTANSFEVHELGGGKASVSFDYRIMARRKGYETVRLADKTKQFQDAVNEPKPKPGKVAHPAVTGLPAYATRADLMQNRK